MTSFPADEARPKERDMVITAVTDELVPQVKEFLSSRKEFGFRKDWDGIFGYRWKRENYPYGYAIVHEGSILGFLGTMFCERVVAGSSFVYCNLTSWVVDDSHKGARGLAVALLVPALKTKNVVITSFTANEKAQRIYAKIGFKPIENQQIATLTIASHFGWQTKRSRREVFSDPRKIERYLSTRDREILTDHSDLGCVHVLVRDAVTDRYCYLIGMTSPIRLRKLSVSSGAWLASFLSRWNCFNVCYVSDDGFLTENARILNKHLLKVHSSLLLRYDSRLIAGRLSRFVYSTPVERLCFSSADLKDARLDNLYSELVTISGEF